MSTRKIRSRRDILRREKRYVVWNHSNWAKIDTSFKRQERHASKHELRSINHADDA